MPPWYVEKDIGIQHFTDDMSLDDREIDALERWWRAGTPEGDPEDLPPPLEFADDVLWAKRRGRLALGPNDHVIGCPLCMVIPANGNPRYYAQDGETGDGGQAGDSTSAGRGRGNR